MSTIKVIDYCEDFGKYTLPEGMEDYLRGLTIEEQFLFIFLEFSSIGPTEKKYLNECLEYCKAVIVKDGVIIGMAMPNHKGELFATYIGDKRWIGSDDCDNNGAGYKTIDYYLKMIFVPDDDVLRILKQRREGTLSAN